LPDFPVGILVHKLLYHTNALLKRRIKDLQAWEKLKHIEATEAMLLKHAFVLDIWQFKDIENPPLLPRNALETITRA
jgi:hypothetical protein